MSVTVRKAVYRNDDGFKIYGRDPHQRSVSIFARSRYAADEIAKKVRGGGQIDLADFYAVPADHPVTSLVPMSAAFKGATDLAECGACGRFWDDAIITSMTPAPSARCPFEYFH